mmetsp:Transcript_15869/g.39412  ORF Transcript_15869/g.39412 Transcript_15869/m.39412 type:complete len:325 (+) Transcript_15869:390-1364(+)|eukprot:CAMPEP_0113473124 /NCGR_PEP_ID=MMETSP0014_2-20120614/17878_1 /TAXON_ID=2857 /ORGANISM="Nitzschia sp." /LENGTH=324 /DNA_ID=CAMNT_0000365873 /DNA_START=276 /DNA_END=1250 /DNA_ORIENTATION=+ /assembly_acc=CAM_ASM_000159
MKFISGKSTLSGLLTCFVAAIFVQSSHCLESCHNCETVEKTTKVKSVPPRADRTLIAKCPPGMVMTDFDCSSNGGELGQENERFFEEFDDTFQVGVKCTAFNMNFVFRKDFRINAKAVCKPAIEETQEVVYSTALLDDVPQYAFRRHKVSCPDGMILSVPQCYVRSYKFRYRGQSASFVDLPEQVQEDPLIMVSRAPNSFTCEVEASQFFLGGRYSTTIIAMGICTRFEDLADGFLESAEIVTDSETSKLASIEVTARCPDGYLALAGGCNQTNSEKFHIQKTFTRQALFSCDAQHKSIIASRETFDTNTVTAEVFCVNELVEF